MTTKQEAETVATAINVLRPDWPTKQIVTIIGRDHQHRPTLDIAAALLWLALDPDTETPGRLNESGPWWKGFQPQGHGRGQQGVGEDHQSPRKNETCQQPGHTGWAGNCPNCRAEEKARSDKGARQPSRRSEYELSDDPEVRDRQETYRRGADLVRQAIEDAKPRLTDEETGEAAA